MKILLATVIVGLIIAMGMLFERTQELERQVTRLQEEQVWHQAQIKHAIDLALIDAPLMDYGAMKERQLDK
jgi:hypothetical protein